MGDVQRLKKLKIKWEKHPAVTGTHLPAKIIPMCTQENDLVVDPMCGVGSILVSAQRLKRNTWGCEIIPEYAEKANEWLYKEKELLEDL